MSDDGVNWGKVVALSAVIAGATVVGITYQPEISEALAPIADGVGGALNGAGEIAKDMAENLEERPAATLVTVGASSALGYKIARGK